MKLSRFFEKVQLRVWRALWYAFQSCRHGISEQGRSCGDRNPNWNQLAAEALRQNVLLTWLGSDGWLGSSKPQEKLGLLMAMVGTGCEAKDSPGTAGAELSSWADIPFGCPLKTKVSNSAAGRLYHCQAKGSVYWGVSTRKWCKSPKVEERHAHIGSASYWMWYLQIFSFSEHCEFYAYKRDPKPALWFHTTLTIL